MEADYGRRGKGSIFGAFQPRDGHSFTEAYPGRTIAHWVDFLCKVDSWVPDEVERIFAILDNLNVHRATDVLLFSLAHPRREFVSRPTYAPSLNPIEPWREILRPFALKGRRFESWEEIVVAVRAATSYWNAHRHPCEWGKRKRRRAARRAGIGLVPRAA